MAYFTSIQNYIDSVTARFNKPKRSLLNDGIVKQDLIDALTDTAKYADDVKQAGEILNANFIQRSLNLSATVYVDGVNGNDTRTGLTPDNVAGVGAVKTLVRVAELYSGKTQSLDIVISGNTQISSNIDLRIPFVTLLVNQNVTLTFKKLTGILDANNVVVGEGTWKIYMYGYDLNVYNMGTIQVEAHNGSTGAGDQYYYRMKQGALVFIRQFMLDSDRLCTLNVAGSGVLNVGNNTTFAIAGAAGTNSDGFNRLARYRRSGVIGGSLVLGTNAIESVFTGDQVLIRSYTPTSSTDAKVSELELVTDATYLYRKQGGIIKKIAWTTF